MIMVTDSAQGLKRHLKQTGLNELAQTMLMRMVLAFLMRQGRMSCSQAACAVASEPIHRGQLTRFLARPRWQEHNFNEPLRRALLAKESRRGRFIFIVDATLVSQAGKKTQNTYSTGNRRRRPAKGRRYNKKKIALKTCHSFTFGLLLTPSGLRIPFQVPHYTREYCAQYDLTHRTTADAAADMIRSLPLPKGADVVVLGDTAYDARAVREACAERGYLWIFPANPERVYEGPKGSRPKLRACIQDWPRRRLTTVKLHASTGSYARYRRLSKWRVGRKAKPRVYCTHQEKRDVRRVGCVLLVFSSMKPNLAAATPDDVKILMTNATHFSVREVLELYWLRWQIELFFKELKSTLGFSQYRFQSFRAVQAWVEIAILAVLYLEEMRIRRLQDRRLSKETRAWWEAQRLHGLRLAFQQECSGRELKYLSERLKTSGGVAKLKRLLAAAIPPEFRAAA